MTTASSTPPEFEAVFRATFDQVTRYVARRVRVPADVADVVASTYEESLGAWHTYDARRGDHLPWLLGIARNLVSRDARRRLHQGALAERISGQALLAPDEFEQIEGMIDAMRLAPRVERAMSDVLTDGERELLMLVREDGLSLADAGRALGITPVAARMRLARARRRVRSYLEGDTDPIDPTPIPVTPTEGISR